MPFCQESRDSHFSRRVLTTIRELPCAPGPASADQGANLPSLRIACSSDANSVPTFWGLIHRGCLSEESAGKNSRHQTGCFPPLCPPRFLIDSKPLHLHVSFSPGCHRLSIHCLISFMSIRVSDSGHGLNSPSLLLQRYEPRDSDHLQSPCRSKVSVLGRSRKMEGNERRQQFPTPPDPRRVPLTTPNRPTKLHRQQMGLNRP